MKVRADFVTNSSSSSFIICKDNISYGKLLKILLEIANEESRYYNDEDYTEEDISENCVAYKYHIINATKESPHSEYKEYGYGADEEVVYDNHYIINNEGCSRYDWSAVKDVLAKYNIPWKYGYCD